MLTLVSCLHMDIQFYQHHFIHSFWRHKLQRQQDRKATRAAQVWKLKSSIGGNWPSRSEGDRSQSGNGEIESLVSLQSPQKVRELAGPDASGTRVKGRRSKDCSANEVRVLGSPLSPARPAAGQPPPAVADSCMESYSRTHSSEPQLRYITVHCLVMCATRAVRQRKGALP